MKVKMKINRREFVVLSTATLGGLAAGLPAFGAPPLASFVSVGYTAARSRVRIGGRPSESPGSFVDATTLLSGDPRFFRHGARMRIHGFSRTDERREDERLDVEVLFSVPELDEPAPFYAFSSVSRPEREMTSHSISFNVPVESTGTVELAIQRQRAGGSERTIIPFAVNDGPVPAIKLNEGLYALAILPGPQAAPDWRSIRTDRSLSRDDRNSVSLVQDSLGGLAPVPFDYLLLSVTRPASPETEDASPELGEAIERDDELE